MIALSLTGLALIAGMLTKRTYGCDLRIDEARRISGAARWKVKLANAAALKAYEDRVRRVTLR